MANSAVRPHSLFTDFDVSLFQTGKHFRLYEKMGSHLMTLNGEEGCYFAVFAPQAESVHVVGDFNSWKHEDHRLYPRWDSSGIWEGFIPNVKHGNVYKYKIYPNNQGRIRMKADPYAIKNEHPPLSGSLVWQRSHYSWNDSDWLKNRPLTQALDQPMSVYEMHLGSWKRHIPDNKPYTYTEVAETLIPYINEMGYTHVEFMPLASFPYEPSWGYQVTGYFAASSRYGDPEDLMYLIDQLHQAGIGVFIDWVPAHFPSDDFSLATFDGSCVYEHPDRRRGFHPDWNTLIFNYGRPEVRSFLISNAFYWMAQYHIDGLRVDAVSSMVQLDYSRNEGEWEPNQYGGRENLEAISFLKEFNTAVYAAFPGIQTIAEESTSFPKVSRPVFDGGLGFGMKWMMGWMHDTLDYFKREFIHRRFHQNDITFSMVYAFSENFMLALSHDEVVHGKASMIGKMSGDEWQKFANLKTLYAYMFTHPGTKLLFMGNDLAPYKEWNFTTQLEWDLLQFPAHKGLNETVKALNFLYRNEKALHHFNFSYEGFEWVNADDAVNSVIIYKRLSDVALDQILVIGNLNITPHLDYKIGINAKEKWELIFNTDDEKFWGSGFDTQKMISTTQKAWLGKTNTLSINIPPLSVTIYKLISSVQDLPKPQKVAVRKTLQKTKEVKPTKGSKIPPSQKKTADRPSKTKSNKPNDTL